MLIVCCGMYRAASTVQYQMACKLARTTGRSEELGFRLQPEPRWGSRFPICVVKDHHWPALAKFYLRSQPLPAESNDCWVARIAASTHIRFLYSHRDIRDVVVSMMQKGRSSFETMRHLKHGVAEFVEYTIRCADHWMGLPNVLVSRYDDLVGDLAAETIRTARHIGVDASDAQCHEIADGLSLDRQRDYIAGFDFAKRGSGPKHDPIDKSTLLHQRHLNDAKSGKWRTILTVEQASVIEAVAGEWLKQHGYS